MIVANKYKIIEKIGSGCFGAIFKGENVRTNDLVAIKVEPIKNNTNLLKNETKIYQYLGSLTNGVPVVKWFGVDEKYNYLVMNLLGESLTDRREKSPEYFSLVKIVEIAEQLIQRIQYVHEKGLIHRDVKPDNFLFGSGSGSEKLYIIDFGFCKKISTRQLPTTRKTIIGTPNFVSINVHDYFEPDMNDDLESAMYIVLYLYLGKLPWDIPDISQEEIKERKNEFILTQTPGDFSALIAQNIQLIRNCIGVPDYELYKRILRG